MRTIVLVLVLLVPSFAAASHVSSWCAPGTTRPVVDAGGYYVDVDLGIDWWTVWVYEETNGIPGLQRRDEVHDDTCGHPESGDTIIF